MPEKKNPKTRRSSKSSTKIKKDSAEETSHQDLTDEELAGVKGAINQIGTSTYLDTTDAGGGHGSVALIANYLDVGTGKKK